MPGFDPVYKKLDSLTIQELIELLHAKSNCDEVTDDQANLILYITELISQKENSASSFSAAAQGQMALSRFYQHYLPQYQRNHDCGPVEQQTPCTHSSSDSTTSGSLAPAPSSLAEKPPVANRCSHKLRFRLLWSVAAVLIMLLVSTMSVNANGGKLFSTIAHWTDQIFRYDSPTLGSGENYNQIDSEQMETIVSGKELLFSYPDGYSFISEFNSSVFDQNAIAFYTVSGLDKSDIQVTIEIFISDFSSQPQTSYVEKDARDVYYYTYNDHVIYFFHNLEMNVGCCRLNNAVITVRSKGDEEDILHILESFISETQ